MFWMFNVSRLGQYNICMLCLPCYHPASRKPTMWPPSSSAQTCCCVIKTFCFSADLHAPLWLHNSSVSPSGPWSMLKGLLITYPNSYYHYCFLCRANYILVRHFLYLSFGTSPFGSFLCSCVSLLEHWFLKVNLGPFSDVTNLKATSYHDKELHKTNT